MKKKTVIIASLSVVVGLSLSVLLGLALTGYYVGWGPFNRMANLRYQKLGGNSETYSLKNVEGLPSSPLKGKNICYLGSSVTYGAASLQESFVEFIAKRNGTTYTKEAVSGTTLVSTGTGGMSYVSRLRKLSQNEKYDLFVCQLSTNDASQNKPLGEINSEDDTTICGAINSIIDYARASWNCPIMFYTNPRYENVLYGQMVEALNEIASFREIGVIDLYEDKAFNAISEEERNLYMADSIHPTKAGYLKWWTPKMEEAMYDYLRGK